MIIESSAPIRIDFAGGTIDIWPLYLFHPGALTLNVAINLYAATRIHLKGMVAPCGGIAIKSCGAVGGKSILFWVEKGRKQLVKMRLQDKGIRAIDFEPCARGLEVSAVN